MKWKFYILLLFSFQNLFSQNKLIDSLLTEIDKTKQDTQLISLKNKLAFELLSINTDSALSHCKEASLLSSKINYRKGLLNAHYTAGRIFNYIGQKDSARIYLDRAITEAKEISDNSLLSGILMARAKFFNAVTERDSAMFYLNSALQISKEKENLKQQFYILNEIGKNYKYNADNAQAEDYFLQALEIQNTLGVQMHKAGIFQNLGNNAGEANELDKSIQYYQEALKIMNTVQNRDGQAMILSLIAYTYMQKGYYPQSLEYYQKSLNLFDTLNNNGILIQDLRGIGKVYEAMENYSEALKYHQQRLTIKEVEKDIRGQNTVFMDIGENYSLRGDFRTAISYYQKALRIQNEHSSSEVEDANIFVNIGSSYERLNQLDSAEVYLHNALNTLKQNKQFKMYASGLMSLGKVYKKQKKQNLAKTSFNEAYAISQSSGFRQFQMEASDELYQLYNSENNHREALNYFKTYQDLKDQLFNLKNMEKVVRLEADFKLEKEKQRLAFEREKDSAQQRAFRTMLLIALAGAFIIILIIARYTHQKQTANKELQRLNIEVSQQKEKLEELDVLKSRFFTNISHEFRTPLTIISGMIDQVKSKPELFLDKGSQMIKQNTLSLLNLINQILELRKLESGVLKLNPVQGDIIQYMRYITESFKSYAENNGINLHFLTTTPSLKMDYDPDKILRVISNLLSNAVKYSPNGGDIYYHLDQKEGGQKRYLQIKIQDTGTGIPKDQLDSIFDRFYQLGSKGVGRHTKKTEGTGIGLALTREFAKLMNGEIRVESELGIGTTFTVLLPITNTSTISDSFSAVEIQPNQESIDTQPLIRPKQDQTSPDKPTLLIVEDNTDIQQLLVACLMEDYQLIIENNGQEGITTALERVPDLIVSDVMMPDKDGFELCEYLKNDERTSHIPIVLLTAKADMQAKITGLRKGADAYLKKPFDQTELQVRLKNLLEIRKKLQEQYRTLKPTGNNHQEDAFIQKVRKAIEKNHGDENFGVNQLCREVALSRAQLHNKIKALTGIPTSIFIRTIRLQKAKHLLESTDLNVSEIAYEVGFKNAAYFSTAFSEEFGFPPSKTRK
ncbi:MAG: tetratricopeptide repeat protein [Bacteroidota bacterium]